VTVASPCTGTCLVVGDRCGACRRTLEEIATWLSLTDAERTRIMRELPFRPDQPDS